MFFLLLTFCKLHSVVTYKSKNNESAIQNISTEFFDFFLIYYLISGESICVQALQCSVIIIIKVILFVSVKSFPQIAPHWFQSLNDGAGSGNLISNDEFLCYHQIKGVNILS